ncbi:hypothetical protein B808_754 [Fructilactobacillus florum 8D]|uniref:NYN domain-containing protein n=1 Tax=Fructilactobacillus florum 8D TaxID=1221538 RepID=W9EDR2_9LACO|nr:NYN domain-containing protein [Fructilactobacillus florum]ETO40268.1 hypothetical protein B808_754 [Fructilactobacillus florum 8D]
MEKPLLVVDGYNIIGAWPELQRLGKQHGLAAARQQLLETLSNYQKYSEKEIVVVFDAMDAAGPVQKQQERNLMVVFSAENQTADSYIEALIAKIKNQGRQVEVATSDHAEQWTIFSNGALRISARELATAIRMEQSDIRQTAREKHRFLSGNRLQFTSKQLEQLQASFREDDN